MKQVVPLTLMCCLSAALCAQGTTALPCRGGAAAGFLQPEVELDDGRHEYAEREAHGHEHPRLAAAEDLY